MSAGCPEWSRAPLGAWVVVVAAGCAPPALDPTPAGLEVTLSPGDPGGDTGEPVAPYVACDPEAGLAVTGVAVEHPWGPNEARVAVKLSRAASVAVVCTAPGDPDERHLFESDAVAVAHEVRLSGLLADTEYTCRAAPVCPTSSARPATFPVQTGSLPDLVPDTIVTGTGEDVGGYLLANASDDCDREWQRFVVFDRQGRARWVYTPPTWVGPSVSLRYDGDGRFVWGGGWEPGPEGRPRVVDLYDGEVYDLAAALPDAETSAFHHDGKRLADGRFATLEETEVEGRRGSFQGFRVRLVDAEAGRVDTTYSGQRALDEGHLPSGTGDAWHANWVDTADRGDRRELLVSLCAISRTIAVDADTGEWLWGFGLGGDFTIVDSRGRRLDDDHYPQCQHGLERVDDRLLVYDNGWSRAYSRAVEYRLDPDRHLAVELWEWTEPGWFETTLGDVDYLPDDHVLVAAGHAECFSSSPGDHTTISEIVPATGEKVWELRYADVELMAYRAEWVAGCALFDNVAACPALERRWRDLAPLFE